MPAATIPTLLRRTYRLLRRTAPTADDYDVAWHGPYYVPRSRQWHPTRFLLYGGHLYATVSLGWEVERLTWRVGSDEVRFERLSGWSSQRAECLWRRVLEQVVAKLRAAVASPESYNRRVQRLLPFACRVGKIERRLTWPRGQRPPFSEARLRKLEKLLAKAPERPGLRAMTRSRFLMTAAVALDAAFGDLKGLTPLAKYQRRADTRHGGLLDLPASDAQAFEKWYESRAWSGSHPWEIVFGHPHGILLSPIHGDGEWRFCLSVDSLGFYVEAVQMAIALLEDGAPLDFHRVDEVLAALRGTDLVEVGPFYDQIRLEELETVRPGARDLVQWDPIPPITLATDEDRRRIARARTIAGSPRTSSPSSGRG